MTDWTPERIERARILLWLREAENAKCPTANDQLALARIGLTVVEASIARAPDLAADVIRLRDRAEAAEARAEADAAQIALLRAMLGAVMDVEKAQPTGDPSDPLSWAPVASYVVAGSVHDAVIARAEAAEARAEAAEALLREAGGQFEALADTIEWLSDVADRQCEWDGDTSAARSDAQAARALAAKIDAALGDKR